MNQPELLWINLTFSSVEAELPVRFDHYFNARTHASTNDLNGIIRRHRPQALCFDFDYPDRAGLKLMLATKSTFPSLPIVMLTVQHSEALAIWAFRSRIWDYLVKPVPRSETDRCLGALLAMLSDADHQSARRPTVQCDGVPVEISVRKNQSDRALAQAIYFVEENYRDKIRLENVARLCGMSAFRFSREFRKSFGTSFQDYTIGYRLKEACRLLRDPDVTVTDVAFAVGFQDPSYFTRVFKQRIGALPSALIGRPKELEKAESLDELLPEAVS